MGLLDMGKQFALNKVKVSVINPKLKGIGEVEEISLKGKDLFLRLRLVDLEEHPLEVLCQNIKFADDASSVTVGKFSCNKGFAQAALDNYVAGREFAVPEGMARTAVIGAKKLLGM